MYLLFYILFSHVIIVALDSQDLYPKSSLNKKSCLHIFLALARVYVITSRDLII